MCKSQIKCYCGHTISDSDYQGVIDRLSVIGSNLKNGEDANLSMIVACSCGCNIIISASVCKSNDSIKISLNKCC